MRQKYKRRHSMDKRGGFEEIRWGDGEWGIEGMGNWGSRELSQVIVKGRQAIAEESADDREVILRLRDNRL